MIDKVVADRASLAITRQRGEGAVLISASEWASIEETLYLLSSPLRRNLSGWCSRRISREHRVSGSGETQALEVLSCRYHYRRGALRRVRPAKHETQCGYRCLLRAFFLKFRPTDHLTKLDQSRQHEKILN